MMPKPDDVLGIDVRKVPSTDVFAWIAVLVASVHTQLHNLHQC